MRVCVDTETGRLLGSQEPAPEVGVLEARAQVEFPEIPPGRLLEKDVSEEEFKALAAPSAEHQLLTQIAELEAMMTPRLIREAMMDKACTVNKPGCCIDGLTPAAALETIDANVAALRAQLSEAVYYQVGSV